MSKERFYVNRRKFLKGVGLSVGTAYATSAGLPVFAQGGPSITAALWQEPENLNPYLAIQTVSRIVRKRILEGLYRVNPQGEFVPVLAKSIPTVANGGVVVEGGGMTVTVELLDDVTWSDGTPVTSSDIAFTWQVVMDDANPVKSRDGYELIEDIDTSDPQKAVIRFSEVYGPYLTLFADVDAVLPQHVLGSTDVSRSEFNRAPVGTGPFQFVRWESGAFIELEANPNYREAGKPLADKLIFAIVPSREVAAAQLKTGQADAMWNLIETQIPEFQALSDVNLLVTPSSNLEYLGLNLSDPGSISDGFTDPNSSHPVLGDPAVRQAIAMAINKQEIVDQLFGGLTSTAVSPISPFHWAHDPTVEPPGFDPNGARQLLNDAGWEEGPGSVRVKDGIRMDLRIMTTTGDKLRLSTQQVVQQNLLDVGINVQITNVPSAVLFSGTGPLQSGDYDIAEDTWGPDLDPAGFLSILFSSNSLPPNGWDFFRINNPELDSAIEQGNAALDRADRLPHYQRAQQLIMESGAYIPLYNRALINAFNSSVSGVIEGGNPWDDFAWDAENWSK